MGRVIEAKKDSVGPVGMLKQLRPAHEVLVREPAHGRLECTGAVSWWWPISAAMVVRTAGAMPGPIVPNDAPEELIDQICAQ